MVTVTRDTAAVLQHRREQMSLTFDQFIYGLMQEGWITAQAALDWLRRDSLPPGLETRLGNLTQAQERRARVYLYTTPSFKRLDQVILEMSTAFSKTPEEMDAFFETYATA